jgi:hypothetical protein
MMTKVINRHRQGRDSRDPEQSLEIGREQTEGCPTSNPQLGDRETEAPIAISASIPRENEPGSSLDEAKAFRAKTPVTT